MGGAAKNFTQIEALLVLQNKYLSRTKISHKMHELEYKCVGVYTGKKKTSTPTLFDVYDCNYFNHMWSCSGEEVKHTLVFICV